MANGQDIFQPRPQARDPFDVAAYRTRIPKTEKIGYLERPGRVLSELLQGGDPMRALLRGRATKPSLGYALFPEAQEKGFQAEDIAAFGVDVLTDPLTYLLPPLIGKVGKLLKVGAKGSEVAFYGDQVNDIMSKLKADKLKKSPIAFDELRDSVGKLLDSKKITGEQQRDILEYAMGNKDWRKGAAEKLFAKQEEMVRAKTDLDVFAKASKKKGPELFVDPGFKSKYAKTEAIQRDIDRFSGVGKKGYEPYEVLDNATLEEFVAKLGVMKFATNPPATGAFGNARRVLGIGLSPITNVARRYGGHSGIRLADALEDLGRTHSIRTGAAYSNLSDAFKAAGLSGKGDRGAREATALLTQSGYDTELPGLTPEFLRKAEKGLSAALEAQQKAPTTDAGLKIIGNFWKGLGPQAEDPRVVRLIGVINNHGKVSDDALKAINDPRALDVLPWMRNYFRENAQKVGAFQDARGLKFMEQGRRGSDRLFSDAAKEYGDDYFPHMWNFDEMRKGTKSYEQLISKMAKEKNISKEQARMLFEQQMSMIPKKVQNIERARLAGEGGYILDPLEAMPRYAHAMEYRVAFAERFGVDGTGLNRLVDAVKDEKLLPEWYMNNIREMAFGRNRKDYGISKVINWVTGWQVMTKMGPASTIANASQTINSAAIFGLRNAMRAMPKMYNTKGKKLAATAYSKEVHNLLKAQAGVPSKSWANSWLEAVQFGRVERWNGFYSAVMGDTAATTLAARIPMATAKQTKRYLNKLKQWGARERHLDEIAATGKIPYESRELIAAKAVETTQHARRWEQMPMMWQNDFARVALQYKNFAYNQTRFIGHQVLKPAIRFLGTGGSDGDIKPLLRMAPLFIGGGEVVTHLRDLIRQPIRAIAKDPGGLAADIRDLNFGEAWERMSDEKQREFFWNTDDWAMSVLRDTLMVGSAGMLGDMWEAAERGKLPEWAWGPTLSDVGEVLTKGARAAGKGYKGESLQEDFFNFRNWAYRRALPGLGPIVPSGIELEKAALKFFR
jgi:hypothetical protein